MNEVNVSAACADKRKADGKLNNKGFSLVEMLIALKYINRRIMIFMSKLS